jgi:hypothetical protein
MARIRHISTSTASTILTAALASATLLSAQVSVLTWHNDNARTGQNLHEIILTPANVNPTTFGKLFVIPVDGKVDAQPLFVPSLLIAGSMHNVLYVVTEHDSAYAFDADTGTQLWHVSLLGAAETTSDDRSCGQILPEIGITSTPAIDLQSGPHGTIYMVAMSKDAMGNYHQRLHALDLTTGAEEFGGPMEIQATYPGSGAGNVAGLLTFDPKQYKERAALLIQNGIVYTSWASHCDIDPYTAWVISYDEATLARVSVLNLTPNGNEGSIWAAGAGPAADNTGFLYFPLANGTFDTTLNAGFPSRSDYGNALVKLSTAGAALSVADYFAMFNTVFESDFDEDLGSGGVVLLPPLNDAQSNPHNLAVAGGKDAKIYVVDTNNMGKFNPNQNNVYEEFPAVVGPLYSTPAWFNGKLYSGRVGDRLKAYSFTNGTFGMDPTSQTPTTFPYPGTTPSISANGTSNGIVWAVENNDIAALHAFDASDLSNELYNSDTAPNGRDQFGAGNKFIVPTIAHGKVYVGTTNGIGVFGLLSGDTTVPGDFNSDGTPDLLWQNSTTGQVLVWYMGGALGDAFLGANYLAFNNAMPGWSLIGAADFNHDGTPDLVWQNTATRQVYVWYLGGPLGNSYLGANFLAPNGMAGWTLAGIADCNRDGTPDLIWRNDAGGQVYVWYMGGPLGNNYLGASYLAPNGMPGWSLAGVADFNHDGIPDLVWQNNTSGQVYVWYMGGPLGNNYLGASYLAPNGMPGWSLAGIADFNRDGTPDLVWQNNTSGQVFVWYMGGPLGNNYLGASFLAPNSEGSWRALPRY